MNPKSHWQKVYTSKSEIVVTFAEDGPEKCSGLPVMRYSAEQLHGEFGAPFDLLGKESEEHPTPTGKVQRFIDCFCRKLGAHD